MTYHPLARQALTAATRRADRLGGGRVTPLDVHTCPLSPFEAAPQAVRLRTIGTSPRSGRPGPASPRKSAPAAVAVRLKSECGRRPRERWLTPASSCAGARCTVKEQAEGAGPGGGRGRGGVESRAAVAHDRRAPARTRSQDAVKHDQVDRGPGRGGRCVARAQGPRHRAEVRAGMGDVRIQRAARRTGPPRGRRRRR
jgi:hypothetical protein